MPVNLKDEMNIMQGDDMRLQLDKICEWPDFSDWDGSSSWVQKYDWVAIVCTPMGEHALLDNDIDNMA